MSSVFNEIDCVQIGERRIIVCKSTFIRQICILRTNERITLTQFKNRCLETIFLDGFLSFTGGKIDQNKQFRQFNIYH